MHLDFTPEQKAVARRDPCLARGGDDARTHRRGRRPDGGRRRRQGMRASARRRPPARRRLAQRVWRTGLYRARTVHLLRRGTAGERPHPAGHAQHRRTDARAAAAPTSRSRSFCPRSWTARSSSRSATPNRRREAIWRRCAPRRCATATITSSTARRCSPAARRTPTTSGWRRAPIRTSRSTRASRSSSCRHRRRASRGSRCTPCRASPPSTPSTTTCACRPARSSAARTKAGS